MSNPSETALPETEPETAASDVVRSIVTFTEVPNSEGGFTVGIGLYGAHQAELNPDQESQRVSIVDVLALAVSHMVRTQPEAFRQSVALVNATIHEVNARLTAGEDEAKVIGEADVALGGALTSARPPANG
jgi:hypothetical protein